MGAGGAEAQALRPASWAGPSAAFPSRARRALFLWPRVVCLQTLRSWNAASALVRVDPLRAQCSLLLGCRVCTGIGVGGRGLCQKAALLQLALDGSGPQAAEEAEERRGPEACAEPSRKQCRCPQPEQAYCGGGGGEGGASGVRSDSASGCLDQEGPRLPPGALVGSVGGAVAGQPSGGL